MMQRLLFHTLAKMVAVIPLILGGCGTVNPAQISSLHDGYSVTRDIIYTPANWSEPILGDLYRPRGSRRPSPSVLLIHGGGWTGSDGRWQMAPIAKQLARRGYVVLNITYRLAPKYIYPAPVDDAREAIRWMRSHATENGIDPTRIAVYGYSAGGYLAAMTGYQGDVGDIRAVVAGGTPANLALYPGGDLIPQFLGGTKQQIPGKFVEASPVNYVSDRSPPTFVYHATGDTLVPLEQPWALIHALEAHKVPHEVYWIERRNHISAFLFPAGAVDKAIDFLDLHMR